MATLALVALGCELKRLLCTTNYTSGVKITLQIYIHLPLTHLAWTTYYPLILLQSVRVYEEFAKLLSFKEMTLRKTGLRKKSLWSSVRHKTLGIGNYTSTVMTLHKVLGWYIQAREMRFRLCTLSLILALTPSYILTISRLKLKIQTSIIRKEMYSRILA